MFPAGLSSRTTKKKECSAEPPKGRLAWFPFVQKIFLGYSHGLIQPVLMKAKAAVCHDV